MDRGALLAGATGLVGRALLARLVDDPDYTRVVALARRPLDLRHPRLAVTVVTFDRLDAVALPSIDDVFCCLGTTIGAAGSQAAFRKVDYDYPLKIAEMGLAAGASQLLLVSAMGADPNARVFYSRVKGELEDAAAKLGFRTVIALRPSLLAGERSEVRAGERTALALLAPLRFLVPAAYRPIDASAVASAMHALAKRGLTGRHVLRSGAIARLAQSAAA
jgi:uncharacterized protein YbjT (DUF2867 family)